MTVDPFNTPEWRAMQAVEMDLHIAADTWHDRPTDPKAIAELHSRVVDYRRTRAAWVRMVATPEEAADLAAELGPPEPTDLCKCGHQHAGPEAAGICIGCPCEEKQ